jgi:hypothetical protein
MIAPPPQMPPDKVLSKSAFGLLLAAVFLAVMALFFTYHDPYRDVGESLVAGGNLEESPLLFDASSGGAWRGRGPAVAWEARGGFDGSGGMRLGTRSSLGYLVEPAKGVPYLRVSARLRTEDIVHGKNGWNTARLLLSFTDGDGRMVSQDVCEITGSAAWQVCERVVPVPDSAVAAQVHAQNLAASGTLWIDDVRVAGAVEKSSTFLWRTLFATLWCGTLVYCAWMARLLDRPLGLAVVALALVIIAGVAAPEPTIEKIVNRGAKTVNGLAVADPFAAAHPAAGSPPSPSRWMQEARRSFGWPFGLVYTVKKFGHFILFGLLALLAFLSAAGRNRGRAASPGSATEVAAVGAALLLFAAAAEVVQFLTTTRTPSLMDWTIDTAGIVAGGAVALLWHHFTAPSLAHTHAP